MFYIRLLGLFGKMSEAKERITKHIPYFPFVILGPSLILSQENEMKIWCGFCVYPHLSCSNRLRAITINAIIFLSAFLVMALKQAIRTRKKNPETNEPPANHKTRNNEAVFDGWRGTGSLVYG